ANAHENMRARQSAASRLDRWAEKEPDKWSDKESDRGQDKGTDRGADRSGGRNGRARASNLESMEPAAAPAPRQNRPRAANSGTAAYAGEQAALNFAAPPEGWRQWQDEWNSIKNHILALMKPALRLDKLPPRQRLAIEFLQREGVNDSAVLHLFRELSENPDSSILQPLAGMVPVKPWGEASWPEKVQLVCGPFGVGKTTVSIRMALALRRMAPAFRICLVNADATRGNGRLLLRHYCDLSDFSYKEASNTLELVGALNEALREGFDRVLVDLPGLSRGRFLASLVSDAGLANMAGDRGIAVHLALDPHFGDLQMQGLIDRYRTTLRGSLVWTKLDEAGHFGQLVNMGMASGLPVSALSFGPGLGNSLVPAEANMLWRLLFKRELPVAQ
ncbi:hypothetical protein LJC46_09635, partial [Desulfovibrio sp. OttesenSCG-928-G15]|nr:hypothetical protein [Desulfovibrio sp. OttesenSCG-928-G15]